MSHGWNADEPRMNCLYSFYPTCVATVNPAMIPTVHIKHNIVPK